MKVMTFNIQHCLDYLNDKIDIDLFVNAINEISSINIKNSND